MKAVIISEPSGTSMEAIMAVSPRHEIVVDKFKAIGKVIGIGLWSAKTRSAQIPADFGIVRPTDR